jgi:hypothetical protein
MAILAQRPSASGVLSPSRREYQEGFAVQKIDGM